MSSSYAVIQQVNCYAKDPRISHNSHRFSRLLPSTFKPLLRELQQLPMHVDFAGTMKKTFVGLVDAFVDSVFKFSDQPLLPSQSNFAPIDELGEAVVVSTIEGAIPNDFPLGVYIRNGANPLFGGLKSTSSVFGKSSNIWVEGEGMLHSLYFGKDSDGKLIVTYRNRHVESETFKLEKQRNKPLFLPALEGDPLAILSSYVFNLLRFGKVNKDMSNTNVFEHSGKLFSVAENFLPQEIDIFTLQTLGDWDVNGAWRRPFTSHPKRAPGTGELVIMGVDAAKPFVELGVISADGNKLLHKVDLKLERCIISHELGVTQRYNIFMDYPLTLDIKRLLSGGPLMKYKKKEYARIGVVPRYGDSDSIHWFEVESNCTSHLLNCFEDGDEVIVIGCRAPESIIPGPDFGSDKFDWFSKRFKNMRAVGIEENDSFLSRPYEWRLNMKTGGVMERNLTSNKYSMDFPFINGYFTGIKNKYGYCQVIDADASSIAGMQKYGGLAKLCLQEQNTRCCLKEGSVDEQHIKVEFHKFEESTFCTGASFVARGSSEEDDGWIITFIHNESNNTSQVHIIDAKKFSTEPIAKITLPCRVPYGFHGAFMRIPLQTSLG